MVVRCLSPTSRGWLMVRVSFQDDRSALARRKWGYRIRFSPCNSTEFQIGSSDRNSGILRQRTCARWTCCQPVWMPCRCRGGLFLKSRFGSARGIRLELRSIHWSQRCSLVEICQCREGGVQEAVEVPVLLSWWFAMIFVQRLRSKRMTDCSVFSTI